MNCDAGHPGVFHTYLDKYNSNTGQWVESAHNSFTTSNASVQLDALAGCPGGPGLYRSRTWFDAVNYYDEPVAVTGGVTRTC
ncbi:hypothetical protein UG55_108538 [Frankia sp. EI5c]|nr:hypothetical protein UG55_108538 [Frankia sp. EI5c]